MHPSIVKCTILFLFLSVGLIKQGAAQQRTLPPTDSLAARYARMLVQQCSLNAAQQKRIEQAYKFRLHELQKLAPAGTADSVARKQSLERIHTHYEKAIKDILTSEQFGKYEQQRQESKAALNERAKQKGVQVKE